jgi:hypothetical protein
MIDWQNGSLLASSYFTIKVNLLAKYANKFLLLQTVVHFDGGRKWYVVAKSATAFPQLKPFQSSSKTWL